MARQHHFGRIVGGAIKRRRRSRRLRFNDWLLLLALGAVCVGAVYNGLPYIARGLDEARAPAATTSASSPAILTGRVVRVVDGDGLVLRSGEEIRLGDFDAPEWNEPGGPEAKAALYDIAYGRSVDCTPCEGARRAGQCRSYDRIIATCRLDGRRLGDLMRARGIAEGGR